jgi:predicted acetyltransferase
MKLIPFSSDTKHQASFAKYINEWAGESCPPNEDYYSMYSKFLENYSETMLKFLTSSNPERLESKEPYVQFYWLVTNDEKIVGTIRYRLNTPDFYGNVGYEISPIHRNKGFGKTMLSLLIEKLNNEQNNSLFATVSETNLNSIKLLNSIGAKKFDAVTLGKELLLRYKIS